MSLLSRILGHDGTTRPVDMTVGYTDGTVDTIHFWASNVDDALVKARTDMVLRDPAQYIVDEIRIKWRVDGSRSTTDDPAKVQRPATHAAPAKRQL